MDTQVRNDRRTKRGVVVSNKMNKTVIVKVDSSTRHPVYGKIVKRSKKFYAHHEGEPLQMGDTVEIRETRPISKLKRWVVVSETNVKAE